MFLSRFSSYWPSDFPRYHKEALIQEFKSRILKGSNGYYIKENEKAIGAMWLDSYEENLINSPYELKGNDKVVKNIFISPAEHGRSLAKKLVYFAVQEARENNTNAIYALVYPHRVASIKTFLALGFINVGLLKSTTLLFRTKHSLI